MKKENCKKCGEEIVFLTVKPTFKNFQPKAIAIEVSPNSKGNIIIHDNGKTFDRVKPNEIAKAIELKVPLHRIHDGNCNKDKKWSKKV